MSDLKDTIEIIRRKEVDVQDTNGNTALIHAASSIIGVEEVRLLLRAKANVNLQNFKGFSALMFASRDGNTENARLLINAKANVNLQNNGGASALLLASTFGHTEIVRMLIANADINFGNSLILASKNNHISITILLINANANIDLQTDKGSTALFLASKYGNTEIVRLLLNASADVNLQTKTYESALDVAENNVIKNLLLRAGTKQELERKVENESGLLQTVFPFPIAGRHHLLFELLVDYATTENEYGIPNSLFEIESEPESEPESESKVDNWTSAIADAELERQRKYFKQQ